MISLLQLDWPLVLLVVFIMLFAGLVHGTLGLGFPMVATPMLAVFLDVRSAILLTLLPTVSVNVASIWNSRHSLAGARQFLPLIGFVLVGSILGAYILASFDPDPFRLALAGLILLYLWTNLSGRIPRLWIESNLFTSMILFGFVAGVSAGITNVMVAILIIFFLSIELPRVAMIPVLNTCFMVGKISQIAVLAIAGLVSFGLFYETFPLAVAAVLAVFYGQRLREKIEISTYRKILHGLLVFLAVTLIVQFFY